MTLVLERYALKHEYVRVGIYGYGFANVWHVNLRPDVAEVGAAESIRGAVTPLVSASPPAVDLSRPRLP
jgi:hypothetical protein